MKKNIINRIESLASSLPIILTTQTHTDYFIGAEANKAQKQIKFNSKQRYPSKTPITREVNHVQQMKTAYKRGGWDAVNKYINSMS